MPNNDSTAPSLSDFFSALSEEKVEQRKKLKERINAPESELSTLFSQLQTALEETNKESQINAKDKLEEFSNLLKSAVPSEKKEILNDVEETNKIVEVVAETFEELQSVEKEIIVKEEEPVTVETATVPKELEEQSELISEIISTLDDIETNDLVNEEIDQITLIRKEFEKFKNHVQQHIANQGFGGAGSGEVRLEFLDDVQSSTAKVNGKFLKYSSSDSKWIGADVSGSSAISDLDIDGGTDIGAALADADLIIVDDGAGGTNRKATLSRLKTYIGAGAADDLGAGDAAVTLTTTSGNITIDAAANNSDIIFKGTDATSDITMLTLDGSEAGAATFNDKIVATELDISGNVDVDGTLEADAITVDGTTLAEFIADTAGAMVSSNTETGVSVTYQDADNTIDFAIDAAQTTITSIYATDLIMGEDSQTAIDFGTANEIDFKVDNAARLTLTSGALYPVTDNQIDLGTSSLEFKDAFFDGTVTSDAFAGPLTGDVTGNADTATALATARTIGGTSFDGTGNIAVALAATATTLANARTIGGVSFDGSANINLPGVNASGSQDTSGTAATVTVTDSTANTNFPVVFHDESNALLDDTGALRYNPSTGELLVPNLTVAGTTTQVDTVTMQAENAVIFEGATADAHETTLTIVDPTADRTINLPNQSGTVPVLAAASNTAVTSTPAELNILDGATVVVGEINALDLGSTAVGTAIASKAVILDSSKDYTGIRNFTITGEIDAATGDFSGDVDVDGTLEADAITVDGTTLAEFIADTAGGMVSSNTETGITVTYQDADNTIDFALAAAQTTITSLLATDIKIGEDDQTKIDFETADEIHFYAGNEHQIKLVDGALVPASDNNIDLGTSSVEFKDAFFDGTVTSDAFAGPLTGDVTGNVSGTAATVTAAAQTNITSLGTLTTLTVDDMTLNGSTISDGGDFTIDCGADIILDADGGNIKVKDNGTTFFDIQKSSNDAQLLSRISDGNLVFRGNDGGSTITALTLDMSEAGAATFNNAITSGAVITSGAGLLIADAGTIGSASDPDAIAIGSDGDVTLTQDLELQHDGAILSFGANDEVSLTHVHDTGILLNSTMAIQFNDASQYINAPSNAILDINATDEIELNATLVDVNANLDVSGTYQGGGTMTTGGNIVIPDDGNIGSASDTDAMAISSDGRVTFAGTGPVFPNSLIRQAGGDYKIGLDAAGSYHDTEGKGFYTYYDADSHTFLRAQDGTGGAPVFRGTRGATVKSEIEENGDYLSATNSYGSTSDERLKEHIIDSGSQWNDIKAMRIRKYSFIADKTESPKHLGVIAQELESSGMHGLVKTHADSDSFDEPKLDSDGDKILMENGDNIVLDASAAGTDVGENFLLDNHQSNFKSVKYSILYMKAVKALQEAMTRIETLETKVAALESA